MINTTVGQLLVNDALPEDLRDYNRTLDKKALNGLLQQVARQYPDQYRDISFKLNQVGKQSAQEQGGMSFGISHLKKSEAAKKVQTRIRSQLNQILADESLTDKQRAEKIILTVGREGATQEKDVLEEARQKGNPLAMQVLSGTRGKPMNLASLLAADMLYSDHRDEVIPIPVLRSYSEGLSPEEYWAGTYGARRGIIATKFATQEAGFLSKQLNQAGHRLVVMGEDSPEEQQDNIRGLVVDTDDMDNEGALLASDVGPYKRNTPLTPKILKHISRLGKKRILVRSPIIGGSPEGGVYARDVGVRENGALPGRGEQVGLQAAQALSEPISQGQLSAKHSGGVAGKEKAVGGFQYINQLIQTPKIMLEGAAHSTKDGTVQQIEEAPAGGQYVYIDGERHYVGAGYELKVKKGDTVEAGDLISDGIPNPAIITKYKGVGEGRRYFVNEFKKSMANSGMSGHRRNIELLARGLINHVKLTAETEDNVPDDIIPYSTLEHTYKPRENYQILDPKKALGQYLERPVLHYTIGTKIRPSMLKDFSEFGVKNLTVHSEPPPFEPYMVRGMYQLQHDPDWMTQMYGSGLKKSLLTSVHRGAKSEERGTSFVPSLAIGTDFGEVPDRAVIQPKAPYPAPNSTINPNIMADGLFKLSAAEDVPGAPVNSTKASVPGAPVNSVKAPAPAPVKPNTPQTIKPPAGAVDTTNQTATVNTNTQQNINSNSANTQQTNAPNMQNMLMLSLLGAGGGYGLGGGQGAMLGGFGLPLMYYLMNNMQQATPQANASDQDVANYQNLNAELDRVSGAKQQVAEPNVETDQPSMESTFSSVSGTRQPSVLEQPITQNDINNAYTYEHINQHPFGNLNYNVSATNQPSVLEQPFTQNDANNVLTYEQLNSNPLTNVSQGNIQGPTATNQITQEREDYLDNPYTRESYIPESLREQLGPEKLNILKFYGDPHTWKYNQEGDTPLTYRDLRDSDAFGLSTYLNERSPKRDKSTWQSIKENSPVLTSNVGVNMADSLLAHNLSKTFGSNAIQNKTLLDKVTALPSYMARSFMPGGSLASVGQNKPLFTAAKPTNKVLNTAISPNIRTGLKAIGLTTLLNTGLNLADLVGALPEFAGGTGVGNLGWNQDKYNQQVADRAERNPGLGYVFNPNNSVALNGLKEKINSIRPGTFTNINPYADTFTGLKLEGMDNPLPAIANLLGVSDNTITAPVKHLLQTVPQTTNRINALTRNPERVIDTEQY